jgi:hypothetical protein
MGRHKLFLAESIEPVTAKFDLARNWSESAKIGPGLMFYNGG